MSHPQPPQRQPTVTETEQYVKVLHNTALVALVAGPVLILLPPRKFDFYTFGLCGVTLYSANYLVRERSGRSIWQHVSQRQRREEPLRVASGPSAELARLDQSVQNQREVWKVQREREIKEDVEEGKGFGDMIMDQIWEVWNWGKKKDDDDD
ncbi:hypothetical protein BDY17DRAFT_314950 [Neohortaea acidophila]|uniref:Uncharacterized protein n=1 Tax=Neohortaea acidophila TaxID=245834 RepID=A0A6A6Q0C6_9PEZI|nr:uncharacterized protein BDY17DRAFT_314950 [Neohortaea acidophila]KAF2485928.1 hypothetical protein BDY17DRAFT_314950 [Neohortaea acidophila]